MLRQIDCSFRVTSTLAIVVLLMSGAPFAVADDAKAGAESAADLIVKFADAVDGGDAAAVKSCFDLSKPASAAYAEYVGKVADMKKARLAVLKLAQEKYGAEVRGKAEALLVRQYGEASEPFAGLKELPAKVLKEGAKFYPPGFKGEATFVKKRGVFLLDASDVLEGVNKEYLKEQVARYEQFAAAIKAAADAATSADDLLARLKGVKD